MNNKKDNRKRIQRVLVSTALIGSVVAISGTALASENTYGLSNNDAGIVTVASINYNDWNANQYWSNDMMWAVNSGLINGYVNAPHPSDKSKGYGNWLNPSGTLTEEQLLAVVLRYAKPDELNNTEPSHPEYWASSVYLLASKYELPFSGSSHGKNDGDNKRSVNRGKLAQSLATLYFGEKVFQREAVQFMYDAGLSNGKTGSGTYEDFGVNDNLQRAHIVTFMKRYHDFVTTGKTNIGGGKQVEKLKINYNLEDVPFQYAPETSQVVQGIEVKYGKHHYGSKTQSEYDTVIKAVRDMINKEWDNIDPWHGNVQYYQEYLDGARPHFNRGNPDFHSVRNRALIMAQNDLKDLMELGLSPERIKQIQKLDRIVSKLGGHESLGMGTYVPNSAYNIIAKKRGSLVAYAQLSSAVYDMAGFDTFVVNDSYSAFMLVKIDGVWFYKYTRSPALAPITLDELISRHPYIHFHSRMTDDPIEGYLYIY